MSEAMTCCVCGISGRRRRQRHCPVGWFYGEFIDEESPEKGPYVLAVCSSVCAGNFWIQGPGDLKTSPSYIRMPKANVDINEEEEREPGS